MTKAEHIKIEKEIDSRLKRCTDFLEHFKDEFKTRPDTVAELRARLDTARVAAEFLFDIGFVTEDKYLFVFDETDKVYDSLDNILEDKNETVSKVV